MFAKDGKVWWFGDEGMNGIGCDTGFEKGGKVLWESCIKVPSVVIMTLKPKVLVHDERRSYCLI